VIVKCKDSEDTDAADVADGVPGGVEPTHKPAAGRRVVNWGFHPPNTLLKQEGLQLAEASFM